MKKKQMEQMGTHFAETFPLLLLFISLSSDLSPFSLHTVFQELKKEKNPELKQKYKLEIEAYIDKESCGKDVIRGRRWSWENGECRWNKIR